MVVLDIADSVYEEMKESKVSTKFSCVRESKIRKNYTKRYFFEAEVLINPNSRS
jgi:hypothetical protein